MTIRSLTPSLLIALVLSITITSCNRKAHIYVYKSQENNFNFPEKELNLPSTGICFSGGGTRAMTSAIGQMKALDSLNLWSKVGYISSVSGGSWASSIFTYYQPTPNGPKNDSELLGTPLGAKQLTIAELEAPISVKRMTHVMTKNLTGKLLEYLLKGDLSRGLLEKPQDIWIDAVGATYLQPFGLYGGEKKYFTLNDSTAKSIVRRSPKLKLSVADFYVVHRQPEDVKRPYLIINSAVLAPAELLPLPKPDSMTGFNYSPLGVGLAKFQEISVNKEIEGIINYPVGGGFIEPYAMGGSAPIGATAPCGNVNHCATIELPTMHKFRLADAVGTSSAAFASTLAQSIPAEILSEVLARGSIIPEEPYWSVERPQITAKPYRFADGGNLENYGIISLIQRKVKKIVVFINTSSPIDTTFVAGQSAPTAKTIDYDFYTLFADYKYEDFTANQIFSKEDFVNVFNQFKKCIRDSTTVLARVKTKTITNDWWGIPAGQEVEILWIYNYSVPKWEDQLNSTIRNELSKGENGMFPNFPHYSTMFPYMKDRLVELSPAMTKLLYELQFWNVFENRDTFQDFFKN